MAKSTHAIRAGQAFVELFADETRLVRGLKRAAARLKAFGGAVRTMGLQTTAAASAMAAPLAASVKLFTEHGDGLAKMARRTGIGVEALSELQYAAGQSGVEVAELENGVRRMQRTLYDAGRGLSTATDALADLGLTADDLADLSPERQFKLLADRISQVQDPTRRAALAMVLFGRSGTQLLPMLADGAAGIESLQAEARRLGLTMRTQDAVAAEVFGDAMDRLSKVVKMGMFRIGAALVPILQRLTEKLTDLAVRTNDWISANSGIIVSAMKVTAAVAAGGMALVALGTAISGLGSALGVLATMITVAATVFRVMVGLLAMPLGPIGVLITAIAALGAIFVAFSGVGSRVLAWLGEKFAILKGEVLTACRGIADALADGNIALAAQILWLSLKMEFLRGVSAVKTLWAEGWAWIQGRVAEVAYAILDSWDRLIHGLKAGWSTFTSWHQGVVEKWAGWIAKKMIWVQGLFDTALDVEAAQAAVDDQVEHERTRIAREHKDKLDALKEEARVERAHRDAAHQAILADIAAEKEARIQAAQEALAAARSQWADSIKESRDGDHSPWTQKDQAKLDAMNGDYTPDTIANASEQAAETMRTHVTGTFNAMATLSLQGSQDKSIEENTKRSADYLKRIEMRMRAGESATFS